MKVQSLYFTAPEQIEFQQESIPSLGDNEVLVKSICSAISPGTEMLVYKGNFPKNFYDPVDPFSAEFVYPFRYGYAIVGQIIEVGSVVNKDWLERKVFSFQPHGTHFIATTKELYPLPDWCSVESACFLANMETSVNLVQDAAPLLGEKALVLGQGVVGLLTASLLAEFPLDSLVTADFYPVRRAASSGILQVTCLDPNEPNFHQGAMDLMPTGADFTIEVSGNPASLDDAISLTGFGGRIVIGSWYGNRKAPVDLGGKFHRSRLRLVSSQVSTISGTLTDRWNKRRRMEAAWAALGRIEPEKWVTHRFNFSEAQEAYRLLAETPEVSIQTVFDYDR